MCGEFMRIWNEAVATQFKMIPRTVKPSNGQWETEKNQERVSVGTGDTEISIGQGLSRVRSGNITHCIKA
jgi:hypothetical protein